jgi:hypothetical protein
MKALWIALCLAVALSCTRVTATGLKHRLAAKVRHGAGTAEQSALPSTVRPPQSRPRSFADFDKTGIMPGDDFLSQIRVLLEGDSHKHSAPTAAPAAVAPATSPASSALQPEATAFVEMGTKVKKVQSFCEICILVMQMKERGQPHLCAGLNDQYYITCVEVLISLLRADKALVYWLKNGCMHMDATGPEIVRPCPAINICSWVPNLFSQPPSIVRDGVESLCPKDNKFLPTIPQEYKSLIPKEEGGGGGGGGSD